jgi:NarL family two-component system response regulator LiaR
MKPANDQRISVLIVEDSPIYREALEGYLKVRPELFEVVGWADRPERALWQVEQHVPDIILLDLVLHRERRAGIEIIYQARQISPETKIVVLTAHLDDDLIFEAIQAGAVTYLLKDKVTGDQLSDILDRVRNGDPPMEAEIARRLYQYFSSPGDHPDQAPTISMLTEREREVLQLVAAGKRNREIAETLVIAEKTVKTHVSNILSKLHLSNRTELKWWYQRQRPSKPGERANSRSGLESR